LVATARDVDQVSQENAAHQLPLRPRYYALTKHEHIWAVSHNPEVWCSGQGSNITALTPELNEFFRSMNNMDDPKHFRLRSIVSKGFTPKENCASGRVCEGKSVHTCR
jgi:cytochrome P450